MCFFKTKVSLLYLLLSLFFTAQANVQNNYNFTSPIQQQRFTHLISELRCLVCQNQSLAESNAPLAQDLKKEVYNQLLAGYSDAEIKHYLVQRYGEYILFNPNISAITFVLWLGPMIFLSGAFLIMYISIRRNNANQVENN